MSKSAPKPKPTAPAAKVAPKPAAPVVKAVPKPVGPDAKKAKKVFKKALQEVKPVPAALPKELKGVAGITMLNDGASPACKETPHDDSVRPELVIRRDQGADVNGIDLVQLSDEVEHALYRFAAVIADARVAVRRERKGSAYMIGNIRSEIRTTNVVTERFLISLQQSSTKPSTKK